MSPLTLVLSLLGLALMLFAMTASKYSQSIISILFGSLLIGLAVADYTEPKVGLTIVLIYSGGLTALTYASASLMSRKEASIPPLPRTIKIVAIPLLASALISIAVMKAIESGACLLSLTLPGSLQDYVLSLALALVIAIGVIVILLGGIKK
ncbi:MAG: hypothetical protein ACP5I2_07460 [Fervidicoccaceae archaeon]